MLLRSYLCIFSWVGQEPRRGCVGGVAAQCACASLCPPLPWPSAIFLPGRGLVAHYAGAGALLREGAGTDRSVWPGVLFLGPRAMAALLLRTVLAAVAQRSRHLRACPGTPRALFSGLAGAPGGAGPRAPLLLRSLRPPPPPALGFKSKAVLRKRCRDCYLVKRNGRWYVLCKTNPKHKQRQMV
ncbi:39S ribosomal protein L36, mitochondrial [Heterocephalus glaber]|uniref:Ribosomal protein n=1 Tax=Heterocephalus glaber TaxID=10181 RepID=A0AAX6P7U9_HETGA|nr:39S ribosomal protein L36, mitochondrial [Heterocephalus glaber]